MGLHYFAQTCLSTNLGSLQYFYISILQFCVKSVINSAILPYEAGVDKEYEYFSELVNSNQAAAQRYSFFAERAISRVCKFSVCKIFNKFTHFTV